MKNEESFVDFILHRESSNPARDDAKSSTTSRDLRILASRPRSLRACEEISEMQARREKQNERRVSLLMPVLDRQRSNPTRTTSTITGRQRSLVGLTGRRKG